MTKHGEQQQQLKEKKNQLIVELVDQPQTHDRTQTTRSYNNDASSVVPGVACVDLCVLRGSCFWYVVLVLALALVLVLMWMV